MPQEAADARAVIFDADGVLVDSYRAHFEAWKTMGRELGEDLTEARFVSTFGMRNEDLMHLLWDVVVPEADIPAWSDWKEAKYREILLQDFPAMDGAVALIDALRAAGFRLAVGSSGPPENVAVCIRGLGREDAFDATVTGAEVSRGKPDPEVFLKAAAKLGVPPARCAVVEDAPLGIEAARAAGMAAIGFPSTGRTREQLATADLVIGGLDELGPELVRGLIARNAKRAQKHR